MLVAQISDLHVAPESSYMRQFVDANTLLRRAVEYLNTMTPRPDVVLATGDLTDHGTADEYRMLSEILGTLEVPLYLVPGNHDEPDVLREVMGTPPYVVGPTFDYTVEEFPVRLVAIDSTAPGRHDGELGTAQLRALEATLGEQPDRPTLCFLHHPPFETGIWWMDCIGLTGARDLESVVRRHPQVRLVVAGHVHRPVATVWGPTMLTTAPSTCHQTALALHPDCPPRITTEAPMLALHQWVGDGFVSHATVFDKEGPELNIAELVSDWPAAKAGILARGPMPKGSSAVG
ncbi:MAG: phosphodiesterase [Actinomycetota bacterium]